MFDEYYHFRWFWDNGYVWLNLFRETEVYNPYMEYFVVLFVICFISRDQ